MYNVQIIHAQKSNTLSTTISQKHGKLKKLINKQKLNTKIFTFQVWCEEFEFEEFEFGQLLHTPHLQKEKGVEVLI
jgi:hypothetical protein